MKDEKLGVIKIGSKEYDLSIDFDLQCLHDRVERTSGGTDERIIKELANHIHRMCKEDKEGFKINVGAKYRYHCDVADGMREKECVGGTSEGYLTFNCGDHDHTIPGEVCTLIEKEL